MRNVGLRILISHQQGTLVFSIVIRTRSLVRACAVKFQVLMLKLQGQHGADLPYLKQA